MTYFFFYQCIYTICVLVIFWYVNHIINTPNYSYFTYIQIGMAKGIRCDNKIFSNIGIRVYLEMILGRLEMFPDA